MSVVASTLDETVGKIGLRRNEHAKGFPNCLGSFNVQLFRLKRPLNYFCNLSTICCVQTGTTGSAIGSLLALSVHLTVRERKILLAAVAGAAIIFIATTALFPWNAIFSRKS